jgi:NAD(P)-dependent dehydrogenase (short-subunit alcohol dehydrogenase family)
VTGVQIDLTDQVALVTGGGAGIGLGIARSMAGCGADVVIAEIDPDRGEQAAQAVAATGRRAVFVPTDVMDTDAVRNAVNRTREEFGRLDILVNNAGGVTARRFLEQSERSWRRHIDINLVSVFAATSAAVPVMIESGRGGSIINVASIEAARAAPMYAVYAACKAGMVNFTRTMALELAEHGVRVNAIAPDMTRTPGTSGLRQGPVPEELPPPDGHTQSAVKAYIPLGRTGVIDECGQLAAFLASPLAAYITGTCVPIDGGTWASGGWLRSAAGGWTLFGTGEANLPAGA